MKTTLLFNTAALLGAAAITWMGAGFLGANPLALLVTVVIAFAYGLGLFELVQYRRSSAELAASLQDVNENEQFSLQAWIGALPASLQHAVAQRIENERQGLPTPVFAPYLVGLLVMLGLLGTFVGMVDTLQGAVSALQGSTELEAIRNGLAAPIEGLGLAFGTSVAGIAASAMLGLNATLSRRERMLVTRELDRQIAGPLRHYSLQHNRQKTFEAMQQQAHILPEVAATLSATAETLAQTQQEMSERLLNNQQAFHQQAAQQYQRLAESVDTSLRDSLAASAQLAGDSIAPIVTQAMTQFTETAQDSQRAMQDSAEAQLRERTASEASWLEQQAQAMQGVTSALTGELSALTANLEQQLQGLQEAENARGTAAAERLCSIQTATANSLETLTRSAADAMAEIQSGITSQLTSLQRDTAATLSELQTTTADSLAGLSQRTDEQLAAIQSASNERLTQTETAASQSLDSLNESSSRQVEALFAATTQQLEALQSSNADGLAQLHQSTASSIAALTASLGSGLGQIETSATEQLGRLETTAATQLASLGQALEKPMSELIATASETPKAAAEVIGRLREEMSNNIERDNLLLEERQAIMQDLSRLREGLQQSTTEQREVVEALVRESSTALQDVSQQFGDKLAAQTSQLTEISSNAAGSAADIASLGESFSLAVQLFSESNTQLIDNLSRIEESMEKSSERSDEQMSYYVAQAREIIDQSMLSQREIIEELRRLGQTGDLFDTEAAS